MAKTAVFDFDHTLIPHDTGYEFMRWMASRSWWRWLLLILMAPLILLMTRLPCTRISGLQFFLWIGSVGQNSTLEDLVSLFIEDFFQKQHVDLFPDVRNEFLEAQRQGLQVVILTGTFDHVVSAICRRHGLDHFAVVGSRLSLTACGAICLHDYCYGENKVTMAKRAGWNPADWQMGYTDSWADFPFIQHCQQKVLVNPSRSTLANFNRQLEGPFRVIRTS